MTYKEVLLSGKRYKRAGWVGRHYRNAIHSTLECVSESVVDMVADDWEIERPSVTLDRFRFWELVRECRFLADVLPVDGERRFLVELAKRLGLE